MIPNKIDRQGLTGCLQKQDMEAGKCATPRNYLVPDYPSDSNELPALAHSTQEFGYHARNASGFCDSKKVPPSPRIIPLGSARDT